MSPGREGARGRAGVRPARPRSRELWPDACIRTQVVAASSPTRCARPWQWRKSDHEPWCRGARRECENEASGMRPRS
eukprot:2596534-Alexandrium_andersonii.AAC.1